MMGKRTIRITNALTGAVREVVIAHDEPVEPASVEPEGKSEVKGKVRGADRV